MKTENLFSYGTLQKEKVQLENYGRILIGKEDTLPGYDLSMIEITDKDVIAISGTTHHPMISYTGKDSDVISGTVFEISEAELKQTDDYEVEDYKRVQVTLKSGKQAWVYVNA